MPVIQHRLAIDHHQFARKPGLSTDVETRRLEALPILVPASKSELGQFMTPASIADFMASLFSPISLPEVHLLDPGAGVGSLTAAFVQRACAESTRPKRICVTAYEIEPVLTPPLRSTLEDCVRVAASVGVELTYKLLKVDFIEDATQSLEAGLFDDRPSYTHAIINPPYKKIAGQSVHRKLLRRVGIEATNLYAAFVSLSIRLLCQGGEMVAITPRSFCNGPYFRPFRRLALHQMAIQRVHVFEARDAAFRDDAVLQENIVYHAVKATQQPEVRLSSSPGLDLQNVNSCSVPYSEVIHPGDPEMVIHLPTSENDTKVIHQMKGLSHTLAALGISVSTGPVVDFRLRPFIHMNPQPAAAPLIYPAHFQHGSVVWPRLNGRKANAIEDNSTTRKWLMPRGFYTLTRRFSSKEERRRVVAAVFDPDGVAAAWIGFENHLNVFHAEGRSLPPVFAWGLALYLNSTVVDRFFRLFNGHTQVNATDLRALPYPCREALIALGKRTPTGELPAQEIIDHLVQEVLFGGRPT